MQEIIEKINARIKELEESKDLWLKQLDKCPFDSTAESKVNECSYRILELKLLIDTIL